MRRLRPALVSLCLMLIVAVVAGLPVYVRPQIDRLRHADAILILGGPDYQRYTFGLDLASQDWAPNVSGVESAWDRRPMADALMRHRPDPG
jgi:hypothetical protein